MNPRFETPMTIFCVVFTHWRISETILDYSNHFCGRISNLMFLQRINQFQWILDLDWNLSVSYLSETVIKFSLKSLWIVYFSWRNVQFVVFLDRESLSTDSQSSLKRWFVNRPLLYWTFFETFLNRSNNFKLSITTWLHMTSFFRSLLILY